MGVKKSFRILKLFFVLIFLIDAAKALNTSILNETVVLTEAGLLQGKVVENLGIKYFSFKGIPYAEPPIGKLRFQAPVPKTSWTGVRPALEHGSYCANRLGFFGHFQGGSEDCLFLNVYTPSKQGARPVMLFIHGGGYVIGSGDSSFYGPEPLVKEDVVLVTINYRLSMFGFLSTNDENAPGNAGLKDMVLALKWVQKNIAKFGGNPNDVTIFGHSSGSAAVHALIISNSTNGLFHKAIMQSGSAIMAPLFQPDPEIQSGNLCERLNITYSNTKEMIEKLQALDFQEIINADESTFDSVEPLDFVPCEEPENTENAFWTEHPFDSLMKGNFKKVPLMLGGTSLERLDSIKRLIFDPSIISEYNSNLASMVSKALELDKNDQRIPEALKEFRNIYFGGRTDGNLLEWVTVESDFVYTFPSNRVVRFCSAKKHPPIYYYEFAFEGPLNPSFAPKKFIPSPGVKGAAHGDELFYLFEPSRELIPTIYDDEKSILMRNRMTKMWSNFAKYGNPTPEKTSLLSEKWNPYTSKKKFYFEIDEVSANRQNRPRMDAISDLYIKYTGHF